MEALVVTFTAEATLEDFTAVNEEVTPLFADVDGLLTKIWIADPDTNTYGGIKLFRDRAALESYLGGEIFKSIVDDPAVRDVSYRRYEVIESLTAQTQPQIEVVAGTRA